MLKIFIIFIIFFNSFLLKAFEIDPKNININYENIKEINEEIYQKKTPIEILYFFSYSCGSCYHFQPYIEQWKKIKNENVTFTKIPVDFRESWEETAKSYFIADTLKIDMNKFETEIYNYIHRDRNRIFFKEDLYKFFNEKFKITENDFNRVYNSLSLRMKNNKATEITDYLEIMGTPTFVVLTPQGNYLTNISLTRDPLSTIVTLEYLTRKDNY